MLRNVMLCESGSLRRDDDEDVVADVEGVCGEKRL